MSERERLIELLLKCDKENDVLSCYNERPKRIQAAEIIADHLLANGVIVPPVSVGQTVYSTEKGLSQIFSGEVYEITKRGETVLIRYTRKGYYSGASVIENFGKTVFLTKKEAEKALERSRVNGLNNKD